MHANMLQARQCTAWVAEMENVRAVTYQGLRPVMTGYGTSNDIVPEQFPAEHVKNSIFIFDGLFNCHFHEKATGLNSSDGVLKMDVLRCTSSDEMNQKWARTPVHIVSYLPGILHDVRHSQLKSMHISDTTRDLYYNLWKPDVSGLDVDFFFHGQLFRTQTRQQRRQCCHSSDQSGKA
jgi:hypothetical protein